MIYILYSCDYELFLGGNHRSEHEVLIEPTDLLLQTCEEIGAPMTLFADVACLWRYRELGRESFPRMAEAQLRDALQRGHDVQAHLHPHWLATEIRQQSNGVCSYHFDPSRFILGHWSENRGANFETFIRELLGKTKAYLDDLLRPASPSYRCTAFRAGGYGLQPRMQQIARALSDAGYLIDSSIVPGMVYESSVNRIDFSGASQEGNYRLPQTADCASEDGDGVFEIPVAALRNGAARDLLVREYLSKAVARLFRRQSTHSRGYTIQDAGFAGGSSSIARRIQAHAATIKRGWMMLELRAAPGVMADMALRYIDRHCRDDRDLYFSASCHAKSLHPCLLTSFKKCHRRLKIACGDRLEAITFQDAARRLMLD